MCVWRRRVERKKGRKHRPACRQERTTPHKKIDSTNVRTTRLAVVILFSPYLKRIDIRRNIPHMMKQTILIYRIIWIIRNQMNWTPYTHLINRFNGLRSTHSYESILNNIVTQRNFYPPLCLCKLKLISPLCWANSTITLIQYGIPNALSQQHLSVKRGETLLYV